MKPKLLKIDEEWLERFILALAEMKAKTQADMLKCQRTIAKASGEAFLRKDALLKTYQKMVGSQKIEPSRDIERLIKMKATRSMSGIVVVSVLTKPYRCPGECLYCPTEKDLPKSYLSSEPAVMRAIANDFDPYLQTWNRLKALKATGHPIDKVNIRVIGGTWSYYPKAYQTRFIKGVFEACNDFESRDTLVGERQTLDELQRINETAKCRVVEISVETRQDYITVSEIKRLRKLGVTKVELGVQSIYDDVLELNRRGNTNHDTILATKLLRDAGFKISYQVMPNLPGSNIEQDQKMFEEIFDNSSYRPDYLKIYPLALVKEADVYNLYRRGGYRPYSSTELVQLLKAIKKSVSRYCRIERVIRDIPAESIVEGGSKISNLRQIVLLELIKEGTKCECIRCRELRSEFEVDSCPTLFREDYDAGDGKEIFLSIESRDRSILYSLLRLRIPSQYFTKKKHFIGTLDGAALIREIHTYGRQLSIGASDVGAAQHQGFGKWLINEAETITAREFALKKVAIISGVGVRDYFRHLGYDLEDSYMIKKLS